MLEETKKAPTTKDRRDARSRYTTSTAPPQAPLFALSILDTERMFCFNRGTAVLVDGRERPRRRRNRYCATEGRRKADEQGCDVGASTHMQRSDVWELHYITPIGNLASIRARGILSYRRAARLEHESVAMPAIQARRAQVVVPGGRRLHEYANLYLNARNPMLYRRSAERDDLVVLRIDPSVLDLPNVVVSDQNAASSYARFAPAPAGLAIVDAGYTFADYWTHPDDQLEEWRHKARMCAEVLVPDRVPIGHITGAYSMSDDVARRVRRVATWLAVQVNAKLFFR